MFHLVAGYAEFAILLYLLLLFIVFDIEQSMLSYELNPAYGSGQVYIVQ